MSHIFISYSKHNQEYARKLADHLLSQGFDVWIDDQIDYGEDWWRTIVRAIRGAKAFVVIMTDESDASDWVQREVTLADKNKIPAFPLWLSGDVDNSENWAIYVRTQYADVRGEKLPGDDFIRRVERVAPRKKVAGQDVTEKPQSETPNIAGVRGDLELKVIRPEKPQTADEAKFLPPDVSSILPPPFEWCEIPAGKVTIEYSKADHKSFDVPQFWMAKYPITNAQYQVFVDAEDGYRDPRWWEYSKHATIWRYARKQAEKMIFDEADFPCANVTWFDAVAFCQWLTARLTSLLIWEEGQVNLPTEWQWQHAAQGNDNRRFTWGNEFDPLRCNVQESAIGMPTIVTAFPRGASPFGVIDMCGNVWEWCLNSRESEDDNYLFGDMPRVVRGGVFNTTSDYATVVHRHSFYPDYSYGYRGFRVTAF
jgi:formylglycine-generating enzyme required for sulfatase activity